MARVRVFECLEDDPPKDRFIAVIYYDDGSRSPVIFLSPVEALARSNAQSWYDAEVAAAKSKASPRRPKIDPHPAAPPAGDAPEEEAF